MAEADELEAIRARRLAELQAERGGVSSKWFRLESVQQQV